uniref:Uncharacterized protein LOC102801399 n=1 Tax=Saccoglossus kowalevskii TaxID=10224 RepID=A0ABM0N099_SACKO
MAATTEEPPELTELIHDIGERAQKTSDDVQDAIDYVSDIKEKLQELCCKNNSSQSGSGTGAGAGAGAGAAVGTIVGVAVAAVIIVSVIITLSVLLTMPSGNSSTSNYVILLD